MDVIKQLPPILIALSLALLVASIGMGSTRDELMYMLRRPKKLFEAVLAVNIIPPLAAGILIWFLPLDLPVKAGIMLMAISPVPPILPSKLLRAGSRREYAVGIFIALSLLTIVMVPLVFAVTSEIFGRTDRITVAAIARTIATGVLLPLAIGAGIRHFWPAFAKRAEPRIAKLGTLLLVLAFLPVVVVAWPAFVQLVGNGTLAAMVLVVVIATVAGNRLGGPDPVDRTTLAMAAGTRHPGIALLLANATFDDKRVVAAVLLFLVVGIVVGVVYKQIIKHGARRLATA